MDNKLDKMSKSMEMLKMDRKIKKEQYTFLTSGEGGCLEGGEGGILSCIKNVKMKQKAGYQRHVFGCSNQAVRQ